jgi:hypothetical protein
MHTKLHKSKRDKRKKEKQLKKINKVNEKIDKVSSDDLTETDLKSLMKIKINKL